jgi:hypothetical protein
MPNDDVDTRDLEPAAVPQTARVGTLPAQPPEPLEENANRPEDAPEELPRRPRNRLLTPLPIALFVVLMTACGFIGGVLVEKGQGSSNSANTGAAGLAERLAGLRPAASAGSSGASGGSSGASGGAGFAGAFFGGGAGGTTVGQVAFIQNGTLYVTSPEGNTIKVTTSGGSTVTKTVKSDLNSIHPGETVVVRGAKSSNGAIAAESIRAGEAEGGGLAALFGAGAGAGGARGTGGGAPGASGASTGGGAGPALFGTPGG